jgi:hypothetical protein
MSRSSRRTFLRTRALHFCFYTRIRIRPVHRSAAAGGTCSSGVGLKKKDRTVCILSKVEAPYQTLRKVEDTEPEGPESIYSAEDFGLENCWAEQRALHLHQPEWSSDGWLVGLADRLA